MRTTSGLFHFRFGKPTKITAEGNKELRDTASPVEIFVQGSLRMRCTHRGCREWVTLNYFPNMKPNQRPAESGKRANAKN